MQDFYPQQYPNMYRMKITAASRGYSKAPLSRDSEYSGRTARAATATTKEPNTAPHLGQPSPRLGSNNIQSPQSTLYTYVQMYMYVWLFVGAAEAVLTKAKTWHIESDEVEQGQEVVWSPTPELGDRACYFDSLKLI